MVHKEVGCEVGLAQNGAQLRTLVVEALDLPILLLPDSYFVIRIRAEITFSVLSHFVSTFIFL
jgi:hypothetical protein